MNDLGFSPGAGGAMRRQMQSLLIAGYDVGVVCGRMLHGTEVTDPERLAAESAYSRGRRASGRLLGVRQFPEELESRSTEPRILPIEALQAVRGLQPDLVIVGNLHAAGWSVSVLEWLVSRGMDAVAYLHDMHFLTGRCAASMDCTAFRSGCGPDCPTASRYPALSPALIAPEWILRRRIFTEVGVPLVANSTWTRSVAQEAFSGAASVGLVPLGLDEQRFSRIDRSVARRLLGAGDGPIVGFGAVDPSAPEKGGRTLVRTVPLLARRGVGAVAFGNGSERFPGALALGFIDDERIMPIVYSAIDCFVTASEAETFGQTALEALACGTPVVALRRGGLSDIVEDGVTGRLLPAADPVEIAEAVASIALDSALRERMGAHGRRFVERNHSLDAQGRAWHDYITCRARQSAGSSRRVPPC